MILINSLSAIVCMKNLDRPSQIIIIMKKIHKCIDFKTVFIPGTLMCAVQGAGPITSKAIDPLLALSAKPMT